MAQRARICELEALLQEAREEKERAVSLGEGVEAAAEQRRSRLQDARLAELARR